MPLGEDDAGSATGALAHAAYLEDVVGAYDGEAQFLHLRPLVLGRSLLLGGGAGISTSFTHSSTMADARSSIDRKAFCTSCWAGSPG